RPAPARAVRAALPEQRASNSASPGRGARERSARANVDKEDRRDRGKETSAGSQIGFGASGFAGRSAEARTAVARAGLRSRVPITMSSTSSVSSVASREAALRSPEAPGRLDASL